MPDTTDRTISLRGRRLRPAITTAVLAMAAFGAAGSVMAEDPPWRMVLELQLRDLHRCTLERIVSVRELQVGSDLGMEGRVRCIDAREYDFTRSRPHQKFEIRLCQPSVC